MNITADIFAAYLKCPTKCFLRAHGETGSGNEYADWVRAESERYRQEGIQRLTDGMTPCDCVSGTSATENLKAAKWRNVKGTTAYVWVFTNLHEVAYVYADSREGDVVEDVLGSFGGVLVSDFYAAYESLPCLQQKCLIHLIRDINDDLLRYPFDDELKQIAVRFGALLRPMIDTVDRHGLRKRFLGKHRKAVDRFYREICRHELHTEPSLKCRERLEKNRETLFTFLEHDGIPWNNNNAEHAMKAFAAIRDVMGGSSTQEGIEDYLILLSICQTCKYQGLDFLDFLRSGEKDIEVFAQSRRRNRRTGPAAVNMPART